LENLLQSHFSIFSSAASRRYLSPRTGEVGLRVARSG